MSEVREIKSPEAAILLTLKQMESVESVLSRCRINELFERRDWMASVSGVLLVLDLIDPKHRDDLQKLCGGLLEMIAADQQRTQAAFDSLEAIGTV